MNGAGRRKDRNDDVMMISSNIRNSKSFTVNYLIFLSSLHALSIFRCGVAGRTCACTSIWLLRAAAQYTQSSFDFWNSSDPITIYGLHFIGGGLRRLKPTLNALLSVCVFSFHLIPVVWHVERFLWLTRATNSPSSLRLLFSDYIGIFQQNNADVVCVDRDEMRSKNRAYFWQMAKKMLSRIE